jgi:hypothetical protein
MLCTTGSIILIPVTTRLCAYTLCTLVCVCVCCCHSCKCIDKSRPQDGGRKQKYATHVKSRKHTLIVHFTVQTIRMLLTGPNVCSFYSHLVSNQNQMITEKGFITEIQNLKQVEPREHKNKFWLRYTTQHKIQEPDRSTSDWDTHYRPKHIMPKTRSFHYQSQQ